MHPGRGMPVPWGDSQARMDPGWTQVGRDFLQEATSGCSSREVGDGRQERTFAAPHDWTRRAREG